MSKLVKHFVEVAVTFLMEAVMNIKCVSLLITLEGCPVCKSPAVCNVTQRSSAPVRVIHTHYIIYMGTLNDSTFH